MSTPVEKYIRIQPTIAKAKTQVWEVVNNQSGVVVGTISWYGGWRKYVFFPENDCFYDWACLAYIGAFCEVRTKEHLYGKKRMAK